MEWTKEKPTKPGRYRVKGIKHPTERPRFFNRVYFEPEFFLYPDTAHAVSEIVKTGAQMGFLILEWLGPLDSQTPKEKEQGNE